ncbi:hypothetical protein ABH853_18480 [Pseudomonas sp. 13.2]|uniref:Uncharacterized protein n=1 Tax=Pseudomonas sp. 13.2 TaxID=3144665 RepID=A0AAU7BDP0_9PSED
MPGDWPQPPDQAGHGRREQQPYPHHSEGLRHQAGCLTVLYAFYPARPLRIPRGNPQKPLHHPRWADQQRRRSDEFHRTSQRPGRYPQLLGLETRRAVPQQ